MPPPDGRPAARVAAGILITRILGFVRERVFAHYFGNSQVADAIRAALRIPGLIRNLLGEGTLSASFIPVYAGMLARGQTDDARRLAGTVVALVGLVAGISAGAGILLAPIVTDFVAPGFEGATRDLTVTLVQILFPMAAVFVLSAWCIGVLSTHRRFFLAFAAPALWNVAWIGTLVTFGSALAGARLAVAVAIGALAGSLLQLLAQLPSTLRLAGRIALRLDLNVTGVRTVLSAWIPVVIGAGVTQLSSVINTQLASFLDTGAVAVLGYAQQVALLPISLFGVSVAAAALPELSRDVATADTDVLRARVAVGARRVAYFVVPSALAFATLATPIIGTLFQTGQFGATDTQVAAGVLAAYAIGLLGHAAIKLFASGFYALGNTRTPVRIAVVAMVVSAALSAWLMQYFGPAGIALGSSVGAFVNLGLLVLKLSRRIGPVLARRDRGALVTVLGGGVAGVAASWAVTVWLRALPIGLVCLAGLSAFGVAYGVVTYGFGHPEARRLAVAVTTWRPGGGHRAA